MAQSRQSLAMAVLASPLVLASGFAFGSIWLLPARRVTDPWLGFALVWAFFLGTGIGLRIVGSTPAWIAARGWPVSDWFGVFAMIVLVTLWCGAAWWTIAQIVH